ncbi:MAG: tRNA (guanosine(37)-N1)-methyltransferase TrmD [Pseudomonadota bacterium]|nr:tRNA (guanosine(37)-N1)-methyltransferase TrmD [Pseudomonadota bacterium]
MRIDVVTLFPRLVAAVAECGVTGRAVERGLIKVKTWNPREYALGSHRSVDDRPYGGGPGMVMMIGPLRAAIQAARAARETAARTILLSPQGRRLNQPAVREAAASEGMILVAGRYEGIDERLIALEIDEEWTIGDYVLSGGELAAMVVIDAVARLQPGALGDSDSAAHDSFMNGLLDYPHYTRPEPVQGLSVPRVLLEGHHAEIARWRRQQALGRTACRRPDLLDTHEVSTEDRALLEEFLREQDERGT